MYDRKILKEFNYESYQERMVRIICPSLKKTVKCIYILKISVVYHCFVLKISAVYQEKIVSWVLLHGYSGS